MTHKSISDRLPGAVCAQYVRCGKPNCHCAQGQRHGPYWYRFWRDRYGQRHKEYVRPTDLEAVRAACAAWQAQQRAVAELLAQGPAAVRWYEGERAPGKDPLAWIERCAEMLATTEMLTRLAYGAFGRPAEQVEAARLVAQMRDAWRKDWARKLGGGPTCCSLAQPDLSAERTAPGRRSRPASLSPACWRFVGEVTEQETIMRSLPGANPRRR